LNTKKKNDNVNQLEKIENFLHFRIDFINILKIFIISFTAFYLIGNFAPFYEGDDASVFAQTTINLSSGSYSITNQLLQETGSWDFVPRHWTKTIHDTAVPTANIGFPVISAIVYTITGYYGLFYIVPIITTIFLITTERIATNLFGRQVGLLTLLFLASSFWILRFGSQYMSDLPFSLFFIVGCFYFLKYFNKSSEKYLLLASGFFVISAFIRNLGTIFFLIEIFIILAFFIYHVLRNNLNKEKSIKQDVFLSTKSIKRSLKITFSIVGPWALFFLFLFSYNEYFFGNPLTMQLSVTQTIDYEILQVVIEKSKESGISIPPQLSESEIIQEARSEGVTINHESTEYSLNSENFMGYFRAVLPFPLSHDIDFLDRHENLLGKYWIGIITPILLISIFLISFKDNIKRREITIFTIFMLTIILLYSALPVAESQLDRNISQRYSIPAFSLFSMMIGFLIYEIFRSDSSFLSEKRRKLKKSFKIIVGIFLSVFFLLAFYFIPPTQAILDDDFNFNNPMDYHTKFPLDAEGLTSTSVVLDTHGYITQYYGAIPLRNIPAYIIPENFNNDSVAQGLIFKVEKLISSGYDVYVLKDPSRELDKLFFRFLAENNFFIFKDHSETFCKIYLVENLNNTNKSDQVCI